MNQKIINELEKQFPKGDKSRGKALVLNSIAQIEIKNIFKDIGGAIEETKSNIPVPINESKLLKRLKEIKKKYESN